MLSCICIYRFAFNFRKTRFKKCWRHLSGCGNIIDEWNTYNRCWIRYKSYICVFSNLKNKKCEIWTLFNFPFRFLYKIFIKMWLIWLIECQRVFKKTKKNFEITLFLIPLNCFTLFVLLFSVSVFFIGKKVEWI